MPLWNPRPIPQHVLRAVGDSARPPRKDIDPESFLTNDLTLDNWGIRNESQNRHAVFEAGEPIRSNTGQRFRMRVNTASPLGRRRQIVDVFDIGEGDQNLRTSRPPSVVTREAVKQPESESKSSLTTKETAIIRGVARRDSSRLDRDRDLVPTENDVVMIYQSHYDAYYVYEPEPQPTYQEPTYQEPTYTPTYTQSYEPPPAEPEETYYGFYYEDEPYEDDPNYDPYLYGPSLEEGIS